MKRIYKTNIERIMGFALADLHIPFIYSFSPRGTVYEIDFALPKYKIGIECDGEIFHQHRKEKDKQKDEYFKSRGWEILRFDGNDILTCINVCTDKIEKKIKEKEKI